ncbi:MAG TPA: hypothetical protein VJT31_05705 [Rugosimonospora sp.]|nr:hypothetical protein [Rugosimonospora sp.]
MRLTVESTVDGFVVDACYELYALAFDPLRTRAAARHLLTKDEFAAEMRDPRIDKYVVWDDHDQPVALTTLATDVTAVAWISPDFMVERYPEHAARGAVYYLGFTLVHPERGRRAFALTINALTKRLAADRAVCGFDVCAANDAGNLGRSLAKAFHRDRVHADRIDVQTYYAADYAGVAGGVAG